MSMSSGAFRANAPDLDVPAMERDLARIPSVTSARVVVEEGQLHEVHIVCGTGRSPKLIGRDVQSLLAARWGVDIDHRKVSVVQLEEGQDEVVVTQGDEAPASAAPAAPPAARPAPATGDAARVVRVTVAVTGDEAEASVTVTARGQEVTGHARGVPSWVGQRRLAAAATLDALGTIDERLAVGELGEITVLGAGNEAVVVTSVSVWRDGFERTYAGAAPVGSAGELRAAAEAVLRSLPLE